MAILKTLLDEEYISKSERSILRALYRANALMEGQKVLGSLNLNSYSRMKANDAFSSEIEDQVKAINTYLDLQISKALMSIRLSPIASTSEETQTHKGS